MILEGAVPSTVTNTAKTMEYLLIMLTDRQIGLGSALG
jgi:hypothetical protein